MTAPDLYAACPFDPAGLDVPLMSLRTFATETEALGYGADCLTRGAAHVGIYAHVGDEWKRIAWHSRDVADSRAATIREGQ